MINTVEMIKKYGNENEFWKNNIESILMDLSDMFCEILDGSGYYAYRNPTEGQKNINISRLGIVGSTINHRIMWAYPKKKSKSLDMGINRELFEKISRKVNLPEPREVKPGRCKNEWVIRIDLSTALKVCAIFAGKEFLG